jgi:D-alanyl-D-alanine carboxypeptidase (penicillin-binding protein 5/6)
MRARLGLLILLALLTAAVAPAPAAAAARPPGPKVAGKVGILVDANTGDVLWGRNQSKKVPPASLTKMLAAITVRASLGLQEVAVTGRDAAGMPARRLALRPGQPILVEQALQALMIVSANDVAVVLAERAAGSRHRFGIAMNAQSRRLGLRGSHWRNAEGLDMPGHVSSAWDLAILGRAVLRDPWLARVVRARTTSFARPDGHRHTLTAHSRFLLDYRGAVGIKTGFTDDAGRCLAAAATRNGRTLIAVLLDSPDPPGDAARLMDWGFGPGRVPRTGLRLPAYVPPASVAELLARPGARPAAATAAPARLELARSRAEAEEGPTVPATTAFLATVALLTTAFVLRRRQVRRRVERRLANRGTGGP